MMGTRIPRRAYRANGCVSWNDTKDSAGTLTDLCLVRVCAPAPPAAPAIAPNAAPVPPPAIAPIAVPASAPPPTNLPVRLFAPTPLFLLARKEVELEWTG